MTGTKSSVRGSSRAGSRQNIGSNRAGRNRDPSKRGSPGKPKYEKKRSAEDLLAQKMSSLKSGGNGDKTSNGRSANRARWTPPRLAFSRRPELWQDLLLSQTYRRVRRLEPDVISYNSAISACKEQVIIRCTIIKHITNILLTITQHNIVRCTIIKHVTNILIIC